MMVVFADGSCGKKEPVTKSDDKFRSLSKVPPWKLKRGKVIIV